MTLAGSDGQGPVNRTTSTLADGSYLFEDVLPGTYSITAEQPADLLDGKETAGNLGGTVDNTQDSNSISNIVIGTAGVDAAGYTSRTSSRPISWGSSGKTSTMTEKSILARKRLQM